MEDYYEFKEKTTYFCYYYRYHRYRYGCYSSGTGNLYVVAAEEVSDFLCVSGR